MKKFIKLQLLYIVAQYMIFPVFVSIFTLKNFYANHCYISLFLANFRKTADTY